MLLKNTPLGDIEVQGDNEKDARAFLDTLISTGQVSEGEEKPQGTHEIVAINGVRTLRRLRFN